MSNFLFKAKQNFKFLQKTSSINSDGDKYVSVSVLSSDNKTLSFVSYDEEVIQLLQSLSIDNLQDITLTVGFSRVFNPKTRFSNWQSFLLWVE